jgi:hypothetical protein
MSSNSDKLKFALVWPAVSSNIQILLINLLIDQVYGSQSFENMTVTQLVKKFLPQQLTSRLYLSTADFN